MPITGDSYITTLKRAHLEWGIHRHTTTRDFIYGEGYLQIPLVDARRLNIYNSNVPNTNIIYNCTSTDGTLTNVELKASGSAGDQNRYAKQFQGNGNLKALGDWFIAVGATIGDQVEVSWTSPTDITIRKI